MASSSSATRTSSRRRMVSTTAQFDLRFPMPPKCHCGIRASVLVVGPDKPSKGKLFLGCPQYVIDDARSCGFFRWFLPQKATWVSSGFPVCNSPGGDTDFGVDGEEDEVDGVNSSERQTHRVVGNRNQPSNINHAVARQQGQMLPWIICAALCLNLLVVLLKN